ncbi:MAG: hypothetical protein M3Y67_03930 [Pseudomonadota bacterium]|nr:hypothetical protein [Pseudomonadota bacterium]
MAMSRVVSAETLDGLAEHDPAALRSRRDLRRIHRAMGTRAVVRHALQRMTMPRDRTAPLRVLELGAGDGSLLLGVARSLSPQWRAVELTLLDRQDLVDRATLEAYAKTGWNATSAVCDVLDWAAADRDPRLRGGPSPRWDLIVANLFLHHFEGAALNRLLGAIAARSDRVFACEPRRARLALIGSHLVGALGANSVTREDAVLSVHAGFRDAELSALWPAPAPAWALHEYPAGLFSHCFMAQRVAQRADGAGAARTHRRGSASPVAAAGPH